MYIHAHLLHATTKGAEISIIFTIAMVNNEVNFYDKDRLLAFRNRSYGIRVQFCAVCI